MAKLIVDCWEVFGTAVTVPEYRRHCTYQHFSTAVTVRRQT